MIDTNGMITVAEAAKRLNLSTEQVRRKLREGKLRGQRLGGQWFVEQSGVDKSEPAFVPLVPPELMERMDRSREAILQRRGGVPVDVQSLLNEVREGGF